MANFFLIDHSLRDKGGHHYDYVRCIARAADDMGFNTIIGGHRGFNAPELGEFRSVFSQTTYQPDSYLAGLRTATRQRIDFLNPSRRGRESLFSRARHVWLLNRHQKRRSRFIHQFATDCTRYFGDAQFAEGDHVFFTTVSELELIGLTHFLARNPQSLQAHWHLQFHFNLFEGRTPEYEKQSQVTKAIRSCFEISLARIPYHQLHFYTTSKLLADQYERLQVGDFEVLPYPVAECFRPKKETTVNNNRDLKQPLRFTCPGAIRREKGHIEYLQPLVNKIWNPHLQGGNLQLVIQRPPKKLVQGEKLELEFPESTDSKPVVDYLPHPLPSDAYSELIRTTDCGLLFYDSRTYFSRRAGVLGELLSCGKPVIVSAGSWLAEQVKAPNFEYVDSIAQSELAIRKLTLAQLSWGHNNVPLPGGVISFDDQRNPFDLSLDVSSEEGGICIYWDWHWPQSSGVYNRVELMANPPEVTEERAPELDDPIPPMSIQTIGHRENESAGCFFHLPNNTQKITIRFLNAFHDSMASIRNVRIVTLGKAAKQAPIGTVGIVAADELELPQCIDEMVRHYDHYRSSAEAFAHGWHSRHEPRRTIAHLLSTEEPLRRAA